MSKTALGIPTTKNDMADELLTRRQLEAVQHYVDDGGAKAAAHAMGIGHQTVVHYLARARVRAGVDTTPQLVRELTRRGELR